MRELSDNVRNLCAWRQSVGLLPYESPFQLKTCIFPKLTCQAINHFLRMLALPRDTLRYWINQNLMLSFSYLEFLFYFVVDENLGSNRKL